MFDNLRVGDIVPSPYQSRLKFDAESLRRLADDIEENGLLNPVLCRPMNGRYELMHGERRWRAFKLLNRETIPGQVREATDLEARRICAAENIHREDLTSVEVIESTIDWLDACLYDADGYLSFGDTAHERVGGLLVKLDSDQKNGTDYFSNKFVAKVEQAFKATNRGVQWLSFLNHDLRPYLKLDEQVKQVAIDHSLNKSQAWALQKVKDEAPEAFEQIAERGEAPVGLFVPETVPIEEMSAREIKAAAYALKDRPIVDARVDRQPSRLSLLKGPRLIIGSAEDMSGVESESVDLIITSPPYNLGASSWPMGGNGRIPRSDGIGYDDELPEREYQRWQVDCLVEMYRVAKAGASLFYNHKVRNQHGEISHPMDWLRDRRNPWIIRQEIIWDRGSTHNHNPSLFWPEDERIYWMTKGKPTLPERPIGLSSVWRFHGPVAGTWHPAPFSDELPRLCISAVGREGITVLDPFAGSCTTLRVALDYGYDAIGVDVSEDYLSRAAGENGWTMPSDC